MVEVGSLRIEVALEAHRLPVDFPENEGGSHSGVAARFVFIGGLAFELHAEALPFGGEQGDDLRVGGLADGFGVVVLHDNLKALNPLEELLETTLLRDGGRQATGEGFSHHSLLLRKENELITIADFGDGHLLAISLGSELDFDVVLGVLDDQASLSLDDGEWLASLIEHRRVIDECRPNQLWPPGMEGHGVSAFDGRLDL